MANDDVESDKCTENCFFVFLLAPYARTTRHEEAFLPKGKKRPRSPRSLGLAIYRFFPDFVLYDGFIYKSCGIVYSRARRTPESEKKKTYVYLIKRKIKKKMLVYVPGTYIPSCLLALEGGVNSNPSSREVILEDGIYPLLF